MGVGFAPEKKAVLYGACGFTGLRWIIAAIGTGSYRAIGASVLFLSLPIAGIAFDWWKLKRTSR